MTKTVLTLACAGVLLLASAELRAAAQGPAPDAKPAGEATKPEGEAAKPEETAPSAAAEAPDTEAADAHRFVSCCFASGLGPADASS